MTEKVKKIELLQPTKLEQLAAVVLREAPALLATLVSIAVLWLMFCMYLKNKLQVDLSWAPLVLPPILATMAAVLYRLSTGVTYAKLKKQAKRAIRLAEEGFEVARLQKDTEVEVKKSELEKDRKAFDLKVATAIHWLYEGRGELSAGDSFALAPLVEQLATYFENPKDDSLQGRFVKFSDIKAYEDRIRGLRQQINELEDGLYQTQDQLGRTQNQLVEQTQSTYRTADLLAEWIKLAWLSKGENRSEQVARDLRHNMVQLLYKLVGKDSRNWAKIEFIGATADVKLEEKKKG